MVRHDPAIKTEDQVDLALEFNPRAKASKKPTRSPPRIRVRQDLQFISSDAPDSVEEG